MQIHYDDESHAADFIRLNEAWISEYFQLEEGDLSLARDPMRIVREGGSLIALSDGGRVVGVCALFNEGAERFQLARMAVEKSERGKGWGNVLIDVALERARSLGASSVYLLSNTCLKPAIHLYRKHGFQVVQTGAHPHYGRCNIVMELRFAQYDDQHLASSAP